MILLLLLGACATATAEEPQRFDVHEAMRQDPQAGCSFCHEADGEALQVDRFETCHGCHRKTRHAGTAEHLVQLEQPLLQRAEQAGLPLNEGKVACLTCHDPHPDGSVAFRSVQSRGASMPAVWRAFVWGEEPVVEPSDLLRRPREGLCEACHGVGGKP